MPGSRRDSILCGKPVRSCASEDARPSLLQTNLPPRTLLRQSGRKDKKYLEAVTVVAGNVDPHPIPYKPNTKTCRPVFEISDRPKAKWGNTLTSITIATPSIHISHNPHWHLCRKTRPPSAKAARYPLESAVYHVYNPHNLTIEPWITRTTPQQALPTAPFSKPAC